MFQNHRPPDLPRLLQQMHAQQMPPVTMAAHPGLPALSGGLGPPPGLPAPTPTPGLLGIGLSSGVAATVSSATTPAHSLSMFSKPDIHRSQSDDHLKSNGKLRSLSAVSALTSRAHAVTWNRHEIAEQRGESPFEI